MRAPSARSIATKLAVLQVVLLATSLMGPALGVVPLPITGVRAAAGTGLDLNGTNQHVTFGAAPGLGAAAFTLEIWFKRTGAGVGTGTGSGGIASAIPLLTKGRAENETPANVNVNYFLGIDAATGVLVADFEDTINGGNHPVTASTVVTNDVWHHAAATYSGSTWNIYLDGVLDRTLNLGTAFLPQSASIQHAALGTAIGSSASFPAAGFFDGEIDEARVWNQARSLAQIQTSKDVEIGDDPALLGLWHLNEGSGTTTADASNSGNSGTLVNAPTWPEGFTPPVFSTANGLELRQVATPATVTNATYVAFGDPAELDLAQFTIETWFRRTGAGTAGSTGTGGIASFLPLVTHGGPQAEGSNVDANWMLGIDDATDVIAADFETMADGTNQPVRGTTVIAMNTWYHAAVTYDGTNWRVYLNGQLETTLAAPPPRSDTIQHAALGVSLTSTGAINAGNLARFHGTLDEVRVWNSARSLAQIRAEINSQLASAPAGLVARWPMNEASGINVPDTATASASNGTINGSPVARVGGAPFNLAFPEPPNAPVLVAPANAATGVARPPTLEVIASDPNGGTVNVQFFGRPLASGNYTSLGAPQAIASGAHATLPWTGLGGGQTYQWFATVNDGTTTTTGPTWTFKTATETSGTVVMAIGDLAHCGETGDTETAAIAAGMDGPIITTGDNVYDAGTLAEYNACYEPTWGPFKSRTRPVPGNHDWGTGFRTPESLTDYFTYFGANATDAGGQSYYSYDLDTNWHVVNLDSECAEVPGGCASGSPQHDWLVADLAANPSKNVIAVWHKPRFSSGTTNLVAMSDIVNSLYAAGVDIALVGHDHIYEVFQPLDPAGNHDPAFGIRHMTVGTGGAEHHAAGAQLPTSIAVNDDTYGVTRLVLHPTTYEWRFFPVAGATFTNSGSGTVHGAPVPGANGLDLGAGGSYVTFGDPAKLDLSTFTIETWFKRTGAGVSGTTGTSGIAQFIPLVTHGGPEADGSNVDANWLLGINDATDVLAADFEDTATGLNHPISGTTPIANGVWHHAAATYDGTTWRLYLDGQLEATEVEGAFTPRSDTTQDAGLGVMLMSNGNPGNTARFQGVVDEARVWSGARSLAQIRSTINTEPTSGTNLMARWGMSEPAGATVGDSIAPLANGSIIGSGSSRVAGAPFDITFDTTPPAAPTSLVATPGDGTVGLTWTANGETDLAGYNVYRSTTSPVALISPINGGTLVTSATYTDNSAVNDTAYFYVVTAVDDSTNESTASNQVPATPTGGPQQPTGLDLGSSGAYVTFGDPAKLDLPTFTIETWFKRTGAGIANETGTGGIASFLPLVTHGGPQSEGSNVDANWILGINDATDVLAADFEDMATGLNHPISGTTPLVNGVWYHAAATYDGTTWRLYLNGRLEATETENATPRSDTTQHAGLGVMLNTSGTPANTARFQGVIDEARVWTGARNLSQIQSGVHQLPATTTGLVARWSMGQGSGTNLDDGIAPDADGTVTGAGTSWPAGAPFDIPTVSAGPNQNVTLPSSALLDGLALDDGQPSALTTTWSQISGPDSAAIANPNSQSTSVSFTGSGPGDYVFRLTAADGANTIFDEIAITVIDPGPAPNFGIDFDGTNDYVTFGDNATLGLSQFTLETWFRRDGAGVATGTGSGGITAAIPLITKGRNESDGSAVDMNYFLGIDTSTGFLVADFEEGAGGSTPGLNHPASGTTAIQNGIWYHAAATYNGTWRIYLNGVLDMTPVVVGQPLRADSTQDAGLGTAMNSTGVAVGAFNGIMDEARIWTTVRSEAQIQAAMTGPLATSPGMVARWSMDEGAGGTIASSAGGTVNGTLTNGPLFVTGTPFVSTANTPPNVPTNVQPTNGATGVSVNPSLQVGVSDPNGGTLTTSFYGRTAGASAAEDFTIVVIPDTQHYVDSSNFLTFNQQTQWIVDNEDDLNVVFVSQLGDITENFDTVRQEFDRADAAMDILDDAGIPNNLAPGNHDMSNPGAVTSDLWDEYFPPGRYNLAANPWYGGWLGEESGQLQRLNKDNYELFTAGGIDFLIIHLEIDMPTYAVQWADEIIDRYPDRQVILSTHAFVNTSNARPSSRVTSRADGLSAAQVWTQLVAPNCNVFMVVNGHYPGEGRLTSTNSCGQPVHQVLTDYQSRANGGDGWLRYYTFRPSLNTIEAYTYSPKLSSFENDATSRFDLAYDMTALAGFDLIGTVDTTSGGTASTSWPGRAPSTSYEWYAVTSDGIADRTSPTWTFTTASGPSNSPPVITAVPNQTNAEGNVVDLAISASDVDNDTITYGASGLPVGLTMNTSTGHITGTIAFTAAAGSPYNVTVTADDPFNPPVPSTFTWTVTNVNREPTFDQDVLDQSHAEGAVISLDAGGTDLDGDPLTYAATNLPPGLSINTSTGLITGTISFTAAAGSPYAVSVTVRDGATVDATDTFNWAVSDVNGNPTFDQNLANRTDPENAVISLDAGGTDPDGDTLTYAATNLPPGLSINTSTGLITGTIAFTAAAGSPYAVSITVSDSPPTVDATDTFTWTVTNVNREPTFDQDVLSRTDPEGTLVNLDAGATDLDGDTLTYAATNLPPGLSINTSTGLITGTISFTAAAGSPYAVSVTVRDGATVDATDTFTWTVTNVNREPTFDQDVLDQSHAEGAVISLDAGGTDLDGDPLTYAATNLPPGLSINTSTGLITGTISFTAAAGSPYAVSVTVRDGATVDATDTFNWAVSDVVEGAVPALRAFSSGSNNASTTSITLSRPTGTVAGDVMLASLSVRGTSTVTAPAGWALIRTDTYTSSLRMHSYWRLAAGADPTTWTWAFSGSRLAAGAIHAYSGVDTTTPIDASGGQAAAAVSATATAPSITTTVTNTRVVGFFANMSSSTWTPPAGFAERADMIGTSPSQFTSLSSADVSRPTAGATGAVSATATASSGNVAQVIALRPAAGGPPPVNNEPTFDQNVPNQSHAENAVISLDAGATDLDNDPLTYAATNLPPGLSINTSTGLITGTIAFTAAAASPYSVSVTVRDGATVDATDTFLWTVANVNREPTFDQDVPNQTHAEGAVISLDAGATDLDGDTLTYAATNLPPGLAISSTTGLITGTIGATGADTSPYSVSVTVRDGATVDATDLFTWTVTEVPPPDQPPTFDQDLADRTDVEGAVISLDAGATDPDNDPLVYEATNLPAGLSINASTGIITGTIAFTAAAGSPYSVSIGVRDTPTGPPDVSDTFSWTVTDVPGPTGPPVFKSASYATNNAIATSIVLPRPATLASGDLLLASVVMRGSSTFTAPAGWTLIRNDLNGTNLRHATWWRIATASEPTSWTWTFSAGRLAAGAVHVYGGVAATPIDVSSGSVNASSTSLTATSVTTTAANDLLVAFFSMTTNASVTPPAGMTERGEQTGSAPSRTTVIEGSDQALGGAGPTGNRVATASTAQTSIGHLIALRGSGAAPPVNNEPTFDQNLGNRTDAEGAVISLDAGATDLDNDALTYAATNLPPGLGISATTGLITGTIASNAAPGPYNVSITVRDGPTVDATDTFTWTVTDVPGPNGPPTFDQNLGNRTDAEGAVISLDAGATDPDGDPLTYEAANLPTGLSINAATGLITGSIAFTAAPGPYNVSVTVRDGPAVDATDTFTWTVTDATPPAGPVFKSALYATNNAIATTLVVPRPATFAAGDVLLASIVIRGSSTITPPAGWTLIRNDLNGTNLRHVTWWKLATAAEPTTYTFTFSAGRLSVGTIHVYGGVHQTNPIDASSGSINASSTNVTALGVTTTAPNDLLVAFYSMTTNASVTPPAGMTERGEQTGSAPSRTTVIEGADQAVGPAGATGNRVATASTAQTSIGHLIALRPAP